MRSNVTLSLDYGAELLGSQDIKDYPIDKLRPAREGNSECLLYAEDATNIRLEGLGVIDGRGTPEFFPRRSGPGGKDNHPRLIRFENCENVTFSGLSTRMARMVVGTWTTIERNTMSILQRLRNWSGTGTSSSGNYTTFPGYAPKPSTWPISSQPASKR